MPKTILIAEDDTFLMKMMAVALEEAGYKVRRAINGEEAIALLEKEATDLLLLDILMPKVDGYGVLEYLQNKNKSLPVVIMLSNLGQDEDIAKCKKLGAAEYFIKSDIQTGELVEKLKKYL